MYLGENCEFSLSLTETCTTAYCIGKYEINNEIRTRLPQSKMRKAIKQLIVKRGSISSLTLKLACV